MDKSRRSNLRKVVAECRSILEGDIAKRIAYYGIREEDNIDAEKLPHLSTMDLETRKRILQAIGKESLGGLSQAEATRRYVQHVAFTYLNRLAALRAMEVRGLIKETIIRRDKYGGRSLREIEIAESNPSLSPDQVLKESLLQAFMEVGKEIRILFDVGNEYSLVFPETRACSQVISHLAGGMTEDDWRQDDVVGWIYQYFNEEARQEFREAKRRPRPDDIPVISQFYTPDWIVKSLTDNTLGRLWLEMHPNSKLKDSCSYLVSRKDMTPEREPRRVRNIKILDPACGSGHFLVYAFDVLYSMYQEDEPDVPASEIPAMILENNLFGIDIDLRSCQLAALALYIKAKTKNRSLRIRKINLVCADVRISDGKRRSDFLERFRDDPDLQKIFARLFDDIGNTYEIGSLLKVRRPFEELFSERSIHKREKQAGNASLVVRGQTRLGERGLTGQAQFRLQPSSSSSPGSELTLVVEKERTIGHMLEELRKFEREAFESNDMGRLIFATEAEKSVGLLELLSMEYDVILMNPPHGIMPLETKEYAKRYFPKTYYDYYGAFTEQGIDLCLPDGIIGILAGRALLVTKSFQELREKTLRNDALPEVVMDLGFKTMEEAHARYVALTLRRKESNGACDIDKHVVKFFRLDPFEWDDKRLAFVKALREKPGDGVYYAITLGDLAEVPGTPYAYWAPPVLIKLFRQFPPLDRDVVGRLGAPKIADVKQGLATADKVRFTRFWWEVKPKEISRSREETLEGRKWAPFADEFYLFYFFQDLPVLVNWGNDGEEIRNYRNAEGKVLSRPQGTTFFFRGGLTWSANLMRTQLDNLWKAQRLPFRILPKGAIFGIGAQGVIADSEKAWVLLAICCSRLIFAVSRLLASENKQGTATTAVLPIAFPSAFSDENRSVLSSLAREAYDLFREWSTGDEVSTLFIKPLLLQVSSGFDPSDRPQTMHPLADQFVWSDWDSVRAIRNIRGASRDTLQELTGSCLRRQLVLRKRIGEIQTQIDEEVYRIYGISGKDKALIDRELSFQRGSGLDYREEPVEKEVEDEDTLVDTTPGDENVKRLISYYVKMAMEEDEDGIVPLNEIFDDCLLRKVRQSITDSFGADAVERIEMETRRILGKSLSDWLDQDYFTFHVTLYRKRPIYWQLASYRLGASAVPPGAFSCFVSYHKLTRDTIPKIISHYLARVLESVGREKERLRQELDSAKTRKNKNGSDRLTRDYKEISKRLEELEAFKSSMLLVHDQRKDKRALEMGSKWLDQKIAEVRDSGWNPVIEYGVRVNIDPLIEAKLLHQAAEKVK